MGFFKPKATDNGTKKSEDKTILSASSLDGTVEIEPSRSFITSETPKTDIDKPEGSSIFDDSETVFDPIEAKESWSKLLGKRIVPKCEHGEDCISLVTKKSGMNRGKQLHFTALIPSPFRAAACSFSNETL